MNPVRGSWGVAFWAPLFLTGCQTLTDAGLFAMSDAWCAKHPTASAARCSDPGEMRYGSLPAAQSWDQENLKKLDRGCPTAVYDAPNGKLELCHP